MTDPQTGMPKRIAAAITEIAGRGETPTVQSIAASVADAPLGIVHQELRAWRQRQSALPLHGDAEDADTTDSSAEGAVVELGMSGAPHTPDAVITAIDLIYAAVSAEISAAEARGRQSAAEEVRAITQTMAALRAENERALAAADARVRIAEEEAAALAEDNRLLAAQSDEMKSEMEALEDASVSSTSDYSALKRERDALQAERDALMSALEEKEQSSATAPSTQQLAHDLQICEAHIAALEAERDRLRGERDSARQAALHAKGERDALKELIGTVKFPRAPARRR